MSPALPAQRVQPSDGKLLWMIDEAPPLNFLADKESGRFVDNLGNNRKEIGRRETRGGASVWFQIARHSFPIF